MPNLDGIIWQNPTVMESLAPVISDVTQRMEGAIQKNEALMQAEAQKAAQLAAQKKIAEAKAKTAAEKAAKVTLPNYVPKNTFEPVSDLLRQEEMKVLTEMGRKGIGLGYNTPEQTALTDRYNRILLQKENWGQKFNDYNSYFDKASALNGNEYELNPTDYAASKRAEVETYITDNLSNPELTDPLSILEGYDMKLDYPSKKIKPIGLQDIPIPKLNVLKKTESQTDSKGNRQAVTRETANDTKFLEDIKSSYKSDPEMKRYIDANFREGESVNFEAAANLLKAYAPQNQIIESDTDVEARDKPIKITVNTGDGKGKTSQAKKSKGGGLEFKNAGVKLKVGAYSQKGIKTGTDDLNTTSFYSTNDEALAATIDGNAISHQTVNGNPLHILDSYGKPANVGGGLKRAAGNNVQWLPFDGRGNLIAKGGKSGVSPLEAEVAIPYVAYTDDSGEIYWIPAQGIDDTYEEIGKDVLRKDYLDYVGKKEKEQEKAGVTPKSENAIKNPKNRKKLE